MSQQDEYRQDIKEGTAGGEEQLSSSDRAALDAAAAEKGEDDTTADDLDVGVAPRIGGDAPHPHAEEAERDNALPGQQD
jgi:hypothetical protein